MPSKRNKLKIFLFSALAALAILVFLAPYVFSTRWGFALLPIKADMKSAHFTWLGPQVIEDVKYTKKGVVFFAPEVKSESSLWKLLFKKGQVVVTEGQISYENLLFEKINLTAHKENDAISLKAKGNSRQGDLVGNFSLTATIQEELLDIQSTFENLGVRGTDFDSLGPSVNLNLNAKITPSIFDISLNLNSEKASAFLETQTNPGYISLKAPAVFNATGAHVTISEMHLPFSGKKLDFAALSFKADGSVNGTPFHAEKVNGPILITSTYNSPYLKTPATIHGVIDKVDFKDKLLQATLTSPLIDTKVLPIRDVTGKISVSALGHILLNIQSPLLHGQLHGTKDNFSLYLKTSSNELTSNIAIQYKNNVFSLASQGDPLTFAWSPNKGGFLKVTVNEFSASSLEDLQMKADVQIHQFSSSAIDHFTGNSNFTTIFGSNINGTLKAQIQQSNGFLNANIYSPNTRFSLDGEIINGTLYLKDTLHAQLTLTDTMSKLFFKKVNPLSISSIASKHPLTFEISPNGTSIPIYPFAIDRLTLPECKIELGQIECKNEGNINIALGLLKAKQLSTENLNLWFAPAIVHINQGVVDLERTEILIAETYDVALWGKLNMVSNEVKMVLGLTADCLKKAFGIKKLPEGYVLHVPMRGTTDHVKIDTKKATLKIAALLAWQQKDIAGALGGGVPGAVLGGVLGKAVPLPDQKANTPAAKRPYPWESDKEPAKKKKTSAKSIKPTDKPAKQLFKILLN